MESDFNAVDFSSIGKYNIYFYDGPHTENALYDETVPAQHALEDVHTLIIDDWNWPEIRLGTMHALADMNSQFLSSIEIRTTQNNEYPYLHNTFQNSEWHNRYLFAIVKKLALKILSSLRNLLSKDEKGQIFTEIKPQLIKAKHFVLHHHLGLGDVICLFGLVKEIQRKYPACRIHLPVKNHYLDSVNALYKYLNPNFKIFTIDTALAEDESQQVYEYAKREGLNILRVGFEKLRHPHHYSMFFHQLGLNYHLSWANFPDIPDDKESLTLYQKLTSGENFNLIIDANSQGSYKLEIMNNGAQNIKLHNVSGVRGIFDWITIIKKAETIHTVGTAAFHLVDRVSFIDKPMLYFHNVNDDFKTVDTKHQWNLVNYK